MFCAEDIYKDRKAHGGGERNQTSSSCFTEFYHMKLLWTHCLISETLFYIRSERWLAKFIITPSVPISTTAPFHIKSLNGFVYISASELFWNFEKEMKFPFNMTSDSNFMHCGAAVLFVPTCPEICWHPGKKSNIASMHLSVAWRLFPVPCSSVRVTSLGLITVGLIYFLFPLSPFLGNP